MDTTQDDMKSGSGTTIPKSRTGVQDTSGCEGMTLIEALLLLLVIVTGALGYYWNVKAKGVAEQEESLRTLTEQRDELQQAVAEHRAKSEVATEEETEPLAAESLEALTAELERLKKERDGLAEECQKWMDKVTAVQKQQEQVRTQEKKRLAARTKQATKERYVEEAKDKAQQDLREAQSFYGTYRGVYFFVPNSGGWYARHSLGHMSQAGIDALTSKDTRFRTTRPEASESHYIHKKRVKSNVREWGYDYWDTKKVTTQRKYSSDPSVRRAYADEVAQYNRYLKLKAMFEELAKHPERYRD